MKVGAHGRGWQVVKPETTATSPSRFLLGCQRCNSTCCTPAPCRCCRAYKSSSAGGTKIYLPDDGRGHRQIMSMAAFRKIYKDEAA